MRARTTVALLAVAALAALASAPAASAYGWPLKPFRKAHPIRATFGDPRYHLGAEGSLSAFHFGVDIVARDGQPVYSVEPGVVVRRRADSVTIGRPSGRRYGYWHVRPVVRSGTHVKLHQLLGYVIKGWGHVHFAESLRGKYRDPLRKGALTPYYDHTSPTISSVQLLTPDGAAVDPQHVAGTIDVTANIYDTPQITPPAPWNVARLAPASVWWEVVNSSGVMVESAFTVNFDYTLPLNALYSWIYAPGTYQNKPHRPGQYIFWIFHGLDTTAFPNGTYTLEVMAGDTRRNVGTATVAFDVSNPTAG
jgi:murein DD-endopeptidase MepM/ murein hydrolase activator NlpD